MIRLMYPTLWLCSHLPPNAGNTRTGDTVFHPERLQTLCSTQGAHWVFGQCLFALEATTGKIEGSTARLPVREPEFLLGRY